MTQFLGAIIPHFPPAGPVICLIHSLRTLPSGEQQAGLHVFYSRSTHVPSLPFDADSHAIFQSLVGERELYLDVRTTRWVNVSALSALTGPAPRQWRFDIPADMPPLEGPFYRFILSEAFASETLCLSAPVKDDTGCICSGAFVPEYEEQWWCDFCGRWYHKRCLTKREACEPGRHWHPASATSINAFLGLPPVRRGRLSFGASGHLPTSAPNHPDVIRLLGVGWWALREWWNYSAFHRPYLELTWWDTIRSPERVTGMPDTPALTSFWCALDDSTALRLGLAIEEYMLTLPSGGYPFECPNKHEF